MVRDPLALVWDVRAAADAIARFITDKSYEDFLADDMLRSAVERQFEIIGEALAQLGKVDARLLSALPEAGNAISFRNVLIHGYAKVDSAIVWAAATQNLPVLRASVESLFIKHDPNA